MSATKTEPIWLNFEAIDRRCEVLGADNDAQRALILGADKSSLSRWRRGQMDITLGRVIELADRLGLSLAQIITQKPKPPSPPPPGPKPPAGPGSPKPPAGPKERS